MSWFRASGARSACQNCLIELNRYGDHLFVIAINDFYSDAQPTAPNRLDCNRSRHRFGSSSGWLPSNRRSSVPSTLSCRSPVVMERAPLKDCLSCRIRRGHWETVADRIQSSTAVVWRELAARDAFGSGRWSARLVSDVMI